MLLFNKRCEDQNKERVQKIAKSLGILPQTALFLLDRGIEDEQTAEEYLCIQPEHMCDPFAFKDMQKAKERIERALTAGERICVFGDYDADGVCSTAILMLYLKSRGADAFYVIPSRHEDGYGMNTNTPQRLHREGAQLIITVDNGIRSVEEIRMCYELGMDVIVTDHHLPGDSLPECEAVVCPTVDENYPNPFICGAGVAFKLVEALAGRKNAAKYISLAGIATVADIVPLSGENRVIAALALENINSFNCPKGVIALAKLSLGGTFRALSTHDFGFGIGPRLNAPGRMEDACMAVDLLMEDDDDKIAEIAAKLDELNDQRRSEESVIVDAAVKMIEACDMSSRRSIVLYDPSWNTGIVGIAAGRIAERYNRPTFLFGGEGEQVSGSARSVRKVDIHAAMTACESVFCRFGGHAFAAGATIEKTRIGEFADMLEAYFKENVSDEQFMPVKEYDEECEFPVVTMRLAKELRAFEPYGRGNEKIVIRTDGVQVRNLKRIGTNGKHLSMTLLKKDQYMNAVFFQRGDMFDDICDMDVCDILYTPTVDDFRGENLKLNISALRPAAPIAPNIYAFRHKDKFIDAISLNILYNKSYANAKFEACNGEERALELLRESMWGSAVLCFTPAGAERLMELAKKNGLYSRADIRFCSHKKDAFANNTVIFAPVFEQTDLSGYRNVLVFDTAVTDDLLAKLAALAPNAAICCGKPSECDHLPITDRLFADRAKMGELYKAVARLRRTFYNIPSMIQALSREAQVMEYEARLGLRIFMELGFVRESGEGVYFVKDAPSRKLEESGTFRTLNSLNIDNVSYMQRFEEAKHGS